jgi:hypothetical protein
MLAKVCSAAVNGIEAYPVEVEVNAGFGDTLIVIIGLHTITFAGCRGFTIRDVSITDSAN